MISNEKCLNNYSINEFEMKFGTDDSNFQRCSDCQFFNYENGIVTCSYFNNYDEGRR